MSALFDFNQAVSNALQDYPKETKNAVFVGGSDLSAVNKIISFFEERDTHRNKEEDPRTPQQRAEYILKQTACVSRRNDGAKILFMKTLPISDTFSFLANNQHFTFEHELCHLLFSKRDEYEELEDLIYGVTFDENLADSFSALRNLKNGLIDKNDIQELIHHRMGWAACGETDQIVHLTAPALQSVLRMADNFPHKNLSPQDILKLALNITNETVKKEIVLKNYNTLKMSFSTALKERIKKNPDNKLFEKVYYLHWLRMADLYRTQKEGSLVREVAAQGINLLKESFPETVKNFILKRAGIITPPPPSLP